MTGTTKGQILTLLKRNGGHSVAELATELKLAPITVRQHLTRLDRDGLLITDQRAGPSGRPHYVFKLSAKAHAAAFPRRTDRLVELLVHEISALQGCELDGLSAQEKTSLVLQRVAQRLAAEYAPLLGGWSLQERVSFVTEVMRAEGGLAEWEKTDFGYEIRDYNCLFHRLLASGAGQGDCRWHQTFLSRTLGVEVRAAPCDDRPAHCCRYLVTV